MIRLEMHRLRRIDQVAAARNRLGASMGAHCAHAFAPPEFEKV